MVKVVVMLAKVMAVMVGMVMVVMGGMVMVGIVTCC